LVVVAIDAVAAIAAAEVVVVAVAVVTTLVTRLSFRDVSAHNTVTADRHAAGVAAGVMINGVAVIASLKAVCGGG